MSETSKQKSQIKTKKTMVIILSLAFLFCLYIFLPFKQDQSELQAATGQIRDVDDYEQEAPIYFYDYPGSFFSNVMIESFPNSYVERLGTEVSIQDESMEESIILLPENKAYTLWANSEDRLKAHYEPIYRATIAIAYDRDRLGFDLYSWQDLAGAIEANRIPNLGMIVEPEYVISSFDLFLKDEDQSRLIKSLARLNKNEKLALFRGLDANSGWPVSLIIGGLDREELPPVLLLWDFQAAQVNRKLTQNIYRFNIPSEGSLSLEFGLYANGRQAMADLNKRLAPENLRKLKIDLLNYGYRLADGSTPKDLLGDNQFLALDINDNFNYPDISQYKHPELIYSDYGDFNQLFLASTSRLRRDILNRSDFMPVTPEQEHIALSFILPLFLIWIATIFFRIDDPSIRRSMGMLSLWFSVAIVIYFIQTMYANVSQSDIIYYIRFLPFLGIVESWYYTGVSLARSQDKLPAKLRRLPFLISVLFYGLAIAFIFNDLHGLSFTLSPFMRIHSLGPIGLAVIIGIISLWAIGFTLLLRCQARIYVSTFIFPLIASVGVLVSNIYFFLTDGNLRSGSFDLINIVGFALVLELSLQSRLIPANSGYIKLFRFSPVSLRLLSEDKTEIYPNERDNIPSESFQKLNDAIDRGFLIESDELKTSDYNITIDSVEEDGLVYHASKISGGYLIWEEDISDILELKNELSEITKLLEQQGSLLARRRNIRSQYLSMNIRRKMIQNLESSLAMHLADIKKSLGQIEKSQDRAFVRKELARVKIMVSQTKRKSNLLVRAEESIEIAEVRLIFNEALQDATTAGINGFVVVQGCEPIPTDELIIAYDYLLHLLIKSVDLVGPSFYINIRRDENDLLMQIIFNSTPVPESSFFEPDYPLTAYGSAIKTDLHILQEDDDSNIRLFIEGREE